MSEQEEFIAPYLLPHEIEDLIISYTQLNNEQVGYDEPMAYMPKVVGTSTFPLDKFHQPKTKPPIGTMAKFSAGGRESYGKYFRLPANVFIVVRNEEWPKSLQVIFPRFKGSELKQIIWGTDLVNEEKINGIVKLGDYLYTVVELDSSVIDCIRWRSFRCMRRMKSTRFEYDRTKHRERQAQKKGYWD